jgi:hypothetical protein
MSADQAARQILAACRRGDAEVVLSLPAKFGTTVHGLLPGLTSDVLALTNLALPAPGGVGARGVPARQITPLTPPWVTALSDRAAERNNEIAPEEAFAAERTPAGV